MNFPVSVEASTFVWLNRFSGHPTQRNTTANQNDLGNDMSGYGIKLWPTKLLSPRPLLPRPAVAAAVGCDQSPKRSGRARSTGQSAVANPAQRLDRSGAAAHE